MAGRPPDPARERWAVIASHLQRLVALQEWDTYQALAQERVQGQLERVGTARDDVRYEQGVLEGMRRLLTLPHTLIAQARRSG